MLLPLLNRQWRALAAAVAVPIAFNVVAWPMVVDRGNFIYRTVPYILSTRDYFNSSVLGNGIYYGLPMWLIVTLRLLFVALAAGMTPEQASKHVQMLLDRVRELHIHHPRSPVARHITVAAACATVRPVPGEPMMALEQRVEAALAEAQANGGNRLIQVKTEP